MPSPVSSRAELAAAAAQMAARGLLQREIACELGVSNSYVSSVINDPTGEKERRRKEGYRGTCSECGGRTNGSAGPGKAPTVCATCTTRIQHEERRWTRATIRAAFQAFAADWGRPPATVDVIGMAPTQRAHYSASRMAEVERMRAWERLPSPHIVVREYGSWPAAITDAGLSLHVTGQPAHREDRRRPSRETVVALLSEHGPMTRQEIDRRRGIKANSGYGLIQRMIAEGVLISESRIRPRGIRGSYPGLVRLAE